jgi:hypothetical protein
MALAVQVKDLGVQLSALKKLLEAKVSCKII